MRRRTPPPRRSAPPVPHRADRADRQRAPRRLAGGRPLLACSALATGGRRADRARNARHASIRNAKPVGRSAPTDSTSRRRLAARGGSGRCRRRVARSTSRSVGVAYDLLHAELTITRRRAVATDQAPSALRYKAMSGSARSSACCQRVADARHCGSRCTLAARGNVQRGRLREAQQRRRLVHIEASTNSRSSPASRIAAIARPCRVRSRRSRQRCRKLIQPPQRTGEERASEREHVTGVVNGRRSQTGPTVRGGLPNTDGSDGAGRTASPTRTGSASPPLGRSWNSAMRIGGHRCILRLENRTRDDAHSPPRRHGRQDRRQPSHPFTGRLFRGLMSPVDGVGRWPLGVVLASAGLGGERALASRRASR